MSRFDTRIGDTDISRLRSMVHGWEGALERHTIRVGVDPIDQAEFRNFLRAIEGACEELELIRAARPATHVVHLDDDQWRVEHPLTCPIVNCAISTFGFIESLVDDYPFETVLVESHSTNGMFLPLETP